MDSVYISYASIETFLIILGLILITRIKTAGGYEAKQIRYLIGSYLFSLAADILCVLIQSGILKVSGLLGVTLKGFSLSALMVTCYFYFDYIIHRLRFAPLISTKKIFFITSVPVIFGIILNITTPFTGWIFQVDANHHYINGPFYFIPMVITYGYLLAITILSVLKIWKTPLDPQRREYILYIVYMIPAALSGSFFSHMPTILPLLYMCMFCVILYAFLTTQDSLIFTDPLTGLYNIKSLEVFLKKHSNFVTKESPLTIFMIDVDRFKFINDTYGHTTGDAALKVVAEALRRTTAQYRAFAARYGGDEFCLILFAKDVDTETVTKSIQYNLELTENEMVPDRTYKLSLSIGFFVCNDSNLRHGLNMADKALYRNKKAQKNIIF